MKLCQNCLDFILDAGYIRTTLSAEGKPLRLGSESDCEFWSHKLLRDALKWWTILDDAEHARRAR